MQEAEEALARSSAETPSASQQFAETLVSAILYGRRVLNCSRMKGRKSSMSEHQEIYRYAVDKECAAQQQNMTNGVFDTVRPHLEGAAQEISRKTPDFLAALQAFLATPNDPTSLTLYNLRELIRDLQRNFEELSEKTAQLVGEQEEPTEHLTRFSGTTDLFGKTNTARSKVPLSSRDSFF